MEGAQDSNPVQNIADRAPITFAAGCGANPGVVADPTAEVQQKIEEERARALKRAERFGVENPSVPPVSTILTHAEKKLLRDPGRAGFVTGIDMMSEEEKSRRSARAARFGVNSEPVVDIDPEAATRMEVENYDDAHEPSQFSQIREDTLYMFGTDNLSTAQVLQYFEGYGPSRVEWINDSACNIVFGDNFTARRALNGTSVEDPSLAPVEDSVPAGDLPSATDGSTLPLPAQHLAAQTSIPSSSGIIAPQATAANPYRIGRPTFKGEPVKLRFATNEDVKPVHKDKPSRWYQMENEKRQRAYVKKRRQQEQQRERQRLRKRRTAGNLRDVLSNRDDTFLTRGGRGVSKRRGDNDGKGRKRRVKTASARARTAMHLDSTPEERAARAARFGIAVNEATGTTAATVPTLGDPAAAAAQAAVTASAGGEGDSAMAAEPSA